MTECSGLEHDADARPLIVVLAARSPWWVVSAIFHLLLIALIGIAWKLGGAVNVPSCEIVYDRLCNHGTETTTPGTQRDNVRPPSSSPSQEWTEIIVPANILSQTELGDRYQTLNSDRPEHESAFGNVDARMFRTTDGVDDSLGGGQVNDIFVDTFIGLGGAGNGAGSGWGGGDGSGLGSDGGGGYGTFGSPENGGRHLMVKRHAGSSSGDYATDLSLAWLASHQETDGHWDTIKHGAEHKNDTAVTGLALLAFLGVGHSERVGLYKANVQRAAAWLAAQQGADGRITNATDAGEFRGGGYPHAIATMALCECAGMGGSRTAFMTAAQLAVDYCIKSQNPDGGWRYRTGDISDLSVTGWHVMALKSAKVCGLRVNPEAFQGIQKFLDSVEIKGDAADNATPASKFSYQPGYMDAPAPYRLNAIGVLSKTFVGYRPDEYLSTVQAFNRDGGLPQWGEDGESSDLYYDYYGTLCNFQLGGDEWTAWQQALRQSLTTRQIHTGVHTGSWPIAGVYAKEWGRVGQTALASLCLGIYSRHGYQVLRVKK